MFAGIPLAVILAVSVVVFATSSRPTPRYRPGRLFVFTPVWYIASRPDMDALSAGAGAGPPWPQPPGTDLTAQLGAVDLRCGGATGTW